MNKFVKETLHLCSWVQSVTGLLLGLPKLVTGPSELTTNTDKMEKKKKLLVIVWLLRDERRVGKEDTPDRATNI